MAACDLAIGQAEANEEMRALVAGDIAAIHERVCLAEEEAAQAAAQAEAAGEGAEEDPDAAAGG